MLLGGVNKRPGTLSPSEEAYVRGGIVSAGLRVDGRGARDWRPVCALRGAVPRAVGSARASIGGSEALAAVRASVMRSESGRSPPVALSVDATPSAAAWAAGEPAAASLGVLLRAGVLSALPTHRLAIGAEHAWSLHVDVLVLRADGSVADAAGLAVRLALLDAALPAVRVERGPDSAAQVVVDESSRWNEAEDGTRTKDALFKPEDVPIVVSLARMAAGGASLSVPIVDATAAEEAAASDALVFALYAHDAQTVVMARRVGGAGLIDAALLPQYQSLAYAAAMDLISKLNV